MIALCQKKGSQMMAKVWPALVFKIVMALKKSDVNLRKIK
jgi:hypothetical protein